MRRILIQIGCLLSVMITALPSPVVTGSIGALAMMTGLTSCASNEEFQQRMDRQTERQANFNERRRIRSEAEDQRYEQWYDRIMQ